MKDWASYKGLSKATTGKNLPDFTTWNLPSSLPMDDLVVHFICTAIAPECIHGYLLPRADVSSLDKYQVAPVTSTDSMTGYQ